MRGTGWCVRNPAHVYVQHRERGDSGCLCFPCTNIFLSSMVWECHIWEEVSLHAVCLLWTAFYCLLSSFAHCYSPTRYWEKLHAKSTWFDFIWEKQTASHLTAPSVSWSLSCCSSLWFFLQTYREIITSLFSSFQPTTNLLLLSYLVCFFLIPLIKYITARMSCQTSSKLIYCSPNFKKEKRI